MHIQISDETMQEDQLTDRNGRPFVVRRQYAELFLEGDPHPIRFTLSLPRDRTEPYAKGRYSVTARSFFVDRYGRLELLRTLDLKPASGGLSKVA